MTRADPSIVISEAREWLGTPYHHQQSVKGVGCDCLGQLRGVWRAVVGPEPLTVPPYSRDWGEVAPREPMLQAARQVLIEIEPADAGPGAVLVFRMRSNAVAKHCGIMSSPQHFIHAWSNHEVAEAFLDRPWRRRIANAFVFPAPSASEET